MGFFFLGELIIIDHQGYVLGKRPFIAGTKLEVLVIWNILKSFSNIEGNIRHGKNVLEESM